MLQKRLQVAKFELILIQTALLEILALLVRTTKSAEPPLLSGCMFYNSIIYTKIQLGVIPTTLCLTPSFKRFVIHVSESVKNPSVIHTEWIELMATLKLQVLV